MLAIAITTHRDRYALRSRSLRIAIAIATHCDRVLDACDLDHYASRSRSRRDYDAIAPLQSFIAFLRRLASANMSTLVKTKVACSFFVASAISASFSIAGSS